MFGLLVLLALGTYFLVSFFLVRAVVRSARDRGKNHWLWGSVAAFLMYNLVFWDWIPTIAAHRYYCAKDAGFWVYKSVDQWRAENPGEIEKLIKSDPPIYISNFELEGRWGAEEKINQRFIYSWLAYGPTSFNLWKHEEKWIDKQNNEIIANYVDYSSSQNDKAQDGLDGSFG